MPIVGDVVAKAGIRKTVTRVYIVGSNEEQKRNVRVDNGETWLYGTYTVLSNRESDSGDVGEIPKSPAAVPK